MNRWLNFGGDPDHRLDAGIVFRFRYYFEMEKAWLRCSYDVITSPAQDSATATALHVACSITGARYRETGKDGAWLVPVLLVNTCRTMLRALNQQRLYMLGLFGVQRPFSAQCGYIRDEIMNVNVNLCLAHRRNSSLMPWMSQQHRANRNVFSERLNPSWNC